MSDKEKITLLWNALWMAGNCVHLLTSGAKGIYKEFGESAYKAIQDNLEKLKP